MFPRIDMKATGRRIRQLRERQGISVRELQEMLGFEQPQAIYKWQRGECLPTVDHLLMLSSIFGPPMQDLLVIDDQEIDTFGDECKGRINACLRGGYLRYSLRILNSTFMSSGLAM